MPYVEQMVSAFRNYKTKSYSSETLCKDLTYTMTIYIATQSGSLFSSWGNHFPKLKEIHSKDEEMLVYCFSSFATHYETPQITAWRQRTSGGACVHSH